MTNAVVVTRPAPQGRVMAQRIAELGLKPVMFPLLEIHPLANLAALDQALASVHDYAMVVFVSPNAIDAALPRIGAWPAGVSIGVVGEGSRRRLAHYGVTSANADIVSPGAGERMDSETLLRKIDLARLRGRRALVVRGETGRELLTDALRVAGVEVTQLAAYRRSAPVMDDARRQTLQQLAATQNTWIMTSSEAVCILTQQAEQSLGVPGLRQIQQQSVLVSHARIGEVAELLGFTKVMHCDPGDDALLDGLRSVDEGRGPG